MMRMFLLCLMIIPGTLLFSSEWGVTLGDNVNIRSQASTSADVSVSVKNSLTILPIGIPSSNQTEIELFGSNRNENWFQSEYGGAKGWVYGGLIRRFQDRQAALDFVHSNIAFRKTLPAGTADGNYRIDGPINTYADQGSAFIRFNPDGTCVFTADGVAGDHIDEISASGRFWVDPASRTVLFSAGGTISSSPDGISAEDYFKMSKGRKPKDKKELQAFMDGLKKKIHIEGDANIAPVFDTKEDLWGYNVTGNEKSANYLVKKKD